MMLELYKDIAKILDKGRQVDSIVIDFAKVFDTVLHDFYCKNSLRWG